MARNKKGNEFILKDDYAVMLVHHKDELIEVKIDLDKVEKLKDFPYTWCTNLTRNNNNHYICATVYNGIIDGKPRYKIIQLTRFLLDIEERVVIDHINHNTLDNRLCNLRVLSYNKNSQHRKTKNSNNKTGYRNVSYSKTENKYIVQLQVNGKNTVLGKFDDVHEAGKFAEKMRQKYYNTELNLQ
jgi:DUF971 family protein